jgi:hypothetical protein
VNAGKLKGLFVDQSSDEQTEFTEERKDAEVPLSSPEAPPAAAVSKKPSLKEQGTIQLETNVKFTSSPPMTTEEKRAARDRYEACCSR